MIRSIMFRYYSVVTGSGSTYCVRKDIFKDDGSVGESLVWGKNGAFFSIAGDILRDLTTGPMVGYNGNTKVTTSKVVKIERISAAKFEAMMT